MVLFPVILFFLWPWEGKGRAPEKLTRPYHANIIRSVTYFTLRRWPKCVTANVETGH